VARGSLRRVEHVPGDGFAMSLVASACILLITVPVALSGCRASS
jgi:hypothetical protein